MIISHLNDDNDDGVDVSSSRRAVAYSHFMAFINLNQHKVIVSLVVEAMV